MLFNIGEVVSIVFFSIYVYSNIFSYLNNKQEDREYKKQLEYYKTYTKHIDKTNDYYKHYSFHDL